MSITDMVIGFRQTLLIAFSRTADPRTTYLSNGPSTLEELFSLRLARGDIDRTQYDTSTGLLTAQFHS